eukprot:s2760_g10.t1
MSLEARVAELEARVIDLSDQLVNLRGVLRTQRFAFRALLGRGHGFSSSDSESENRGLRRRATSLPPSSGTLQASILTWTRPSSSLQRPVPTAAPGADELSWPEREALAAEIGEWFSLSLEGAAPILSGRERLHLPSELWVVVRDFAGQIYTPVRVFRTWSSCRNLCYQHGTTGASVCVGFPTEREAKIAVSAGHLDWPSVIEL